MYEIVKAEGEIQLRQDSRFVVVGILGLGRIAEKRKAQPTAV